jgi:hypothetical protein
MAMVVNGSLARPDAAFGRVRVDVTSLRGSRRPNGVAARGPNNASPNQIIGEVIIHGFARPLRGTTSYYPMAVDQALVEQSNRDRVSQFVRAFAYWVAREV